MRMSKPIFLPVLSAALLICCAADRSSPSLGQIECPKVIAVEQILQIPQRGWESIEDDTPLQLRSIAIYEGHPKEKSALAPDQESEVSGRLVSTWHLTDNGKRRYWIACYYNHSQIVLTRLIGPEASVCQVTRDPHISVAGEPMILDVTFK